MSSFLAGSGLEGGVVGRRLAFIVSALMIGAALIAVTVIFLAFAAYLALLEQFAPWQAAVFVAGSALLIAATLLGLGLRSLGKTADQVNRAVKASALAVIAPTAIRFAARNTRLAASLAALAGTLIALWRARKPAAGKQDQH